MIDRIQAIQIGYELLRAYKLTGHSMLYGGGRATDFVRGLADKYSDAEAIAQLMEAGEYNCATEEQPVYLYWRQFPENFVFSLGGFSLDEVHNQNAALSFLLSMLRNPTWVVDDHADQIIRIVTQMLQDRQAHLEHIGNKGLSMVDFSVKKR